MNPHDYEQLMDESDWMIELLRTGSLSGTDTDRAIVAAENLRTALWNLSKDARVVEVTKEGA